MKKIILISMLFVAILSCSKSDDLVPTKSEETIQKIYLPSKIMKGTIEKLFTYDGNKIKKITDLGLSRDEYTYNGDLIATKVQYDASGNLRETVTYTYNNGILSSYKTNLQTALFFENCVLTYNTGQTISYTINLVNKLVPTTTTIQETGKYTFLNGNIIKVETKVDQTANGGSLKETIETYEFDTKNNLTKNIVGFNKIYSEIGNMSLNNIVKKTSSIKTVTGTTETLETNVNIRNEYLYNSDNFPTEKKQYNPTILGLTFQYFY